MRGSEWEIDLGVSVKVLMVLDSSKRILNRAGQRLAESELKRYLIDQLSGINLFPEKAYAFDKKNC